MKLAIIGYGKMGKAIERFAIEEGHEVVLKIGSRNQQDLTIDNLQKADVAVEFTNPNAVIANLRTCFEAKIPVVTGSTGWYRHLEEVKAKCMELDGTLFYASNFSIGVQILFEMNRKLAKIMNRFGNYDVNVHEIHHTQKLDAPSGTGLTIAEDIIYYIDRKEGWKEDESTEKNQLLVRSERIGTTPGTHKITYTSAIDSLELNHIAHNRDGFAKGALMAVNFVKDKQGVYTLRDLLAFED